MNQEVQSKNLPLPIQSLSRIEPIASLVEDNTVSAHDPERYSRKRFKGIHRRVVELAMQGHEEDEIAEQVGLGTRAVGHILKGEAALTMINSFVAQFEDAAEELSINVQAGAVIGFATQLQLMTDETTPAGVRASIAKDLQDRGGPARKEEHNNMHVIATARLEELRNIIKRGETE